MKASCPNCGTHGDWTLFVADVQSPCVPRALKLLGEIAAAVEAGGIERRGRVWDVSPQQWAVALQQMLDTRDRLQLPLKSHGYLYEILVGLVDRGEAQAEREHEQQVRAAGDERRQRILNVQRTIDSRNAWLAERNLAPLTEGQAIRYWVEAGLEPPHGG